ncbi:MAG: nodulation protein NfeD [Chloroflexaceae bacterium]|nr:nodulation protein NfeD [Chloroflexaceae bacterium]
MRNRGLSLLVFLILAFQFPWNVGAQEYGKIYRVEVEGIVTTMTVEYLKRALRVAEASKATALILHLSNGGAVLRDIRPFATRLAEAEVPVVVYVGPEGTEAGAAGAFFLSAAHFAAMAPETSFGTPVPLADVEQLLTNQTRELVLDSVSEQLREWNTRRGRSAGWVDRAVRQGVILTNEQAMAATPPAIDIVARDMDELLTLLEGRVVQLASGSTVHLHTMGRQTVLLPPSPWERFLLLLADPTVVFLLLVMSFVALYAELTQPGVGVFAGLGVVLFLGSLVGLVVLPIRWISLVGLCLAFALMAADLFVPTHGGLTVTGLVLMMVSALTLIDAAQAPRVFIALWAILLVALVVASVAAVMIWLILHLRSHPVSTGEEGMIGQLAEVRKRLAPDGLVFIEGALWRAVCENGEAEVGEWVRIVTVHHLRLVVQRVENVEDHTLRRSGAETRDTSDE